MRFQESREELPHSPRVLQVINNLAVGGAEHELFYFLQEAVKDSSFSFEVCTIWEEGNLHEEIASLGIPVFCLSPRHKYSLWNIWKINQVIRTGFYDIVHVHLFPASIYAALATIFQRNPLFVFTEHSESNRRRVHRLLRPIEAWQYNRFDLILAVSKSVKDELMHWQPRIAERITIAENAIPVDKIPAYRKGASRPEDKEIDILYIGRLIQAKGVDVLLQSIFKAQGCIDRPIRTCILGDGPQRRMLEQMASNLGLGNVSFLGFQKDVFYWMAKAKVMVLPSRWEGLPIALLEAMAFGIPVICTTVGGIADVIEQDDSGILIPPGNTNELSAAICRILEDGDLRDRLATRARVTVNERFDVKKLVKQILDLYRTMLDSRGKDKGRIS